MTEKYETLKSKQTQEGIEIFFNKRIPIYVYLFILLIILGIYLFATNNIDSVGFIFLLLLSTIVPAYYWFLENRKKRNSWLITKDELICNLGNERKLLQLNKIKEINVEVKIDKIFPNLPYMLTGINKVVFKLDDGIFYPGFNFDFKGNAEKFAEFLKDNIKVTA
jgi:hypothetical protein